MFRRLYTLLLLIFITISIAYAKEVNVDIYGLVCEFCAVTIEKNFKKMDEVKDVKIDLDKKKIFLTFEDGKDLADEEISDIIMNNGYTFTKINS